MRYRNKGYTIEIDLPGKYRDKGYSVECTYKYDKNKDKYSLSMWLKRSDVDDKFKIESQHIDTQYISGTKETIRNVIVQIVEYASSVRFFDYFVEDYEYTYKCFDKGEELIRA